MSDDYNMRDTGDGRAEKNNQKALLRRRKGWIGFVHGYNDWLASDGYENVKWNDDPEASGAKVVRREGNKIIYKF